MGSRSFNPHRRTLQTYDDLIRTVTFRYGEDAQGIVLVLYEELIALRHILAEEPHCFPVRAWIQRIASLLERRYAEQPVAPAYDHPTAVVGTDPVVVQFSREVFEDRYRKVMPIVEPEIFELTGPTVTGIQAGKPYMYVVDDEGRFLVWNRPFSFDELVFGRNRATVAGVPVGHPMLVPERLRASAAGEIVFIGDPDVRAVIVNNKSGHFRFPPSCRSVILDKCRSVLQLPDSAIDIFIVGGFDPARLRRTLVVPPETLVPERSPVEPVEPVGGQAP